MVLVERHLHHLELAWRKLRKRHKPGAHFLSFIFDSLFLHRQDFQEDYDINVAHNQQVDMNFCYKDPSEKSITILAFRCSWPARSVKFALAD
jgi:hypothetical protein